MSAQHPDRWIVLVRKVPRGPFSREEILDLLQSRTLSGNDLALKMANEPKPDWKFLWQYPEFDRRASPPPEAPQVVERRGRKSTAPPETLVPEDILSISPDQLVVRTRSRFEDLPEGTTPSSRFTLPPIKTVGTIGAVSALGLLWLLIQGIEVAPLPAPVTSKVNEPTPMHASRRAASVEPRSGSPLTVSPIQPRAVSPSEGESEDAADNPEEMPGRKTRTSSEPEEAHDELIEESEALSQDDKKFLEELIAKERRRAEERELEDGEEPEEADRD